MYRAVPGTIPHRVIDFLKSQKPGTKFTSAEIADALGIEDGYRHMTGYLSSAVAHDVILREMVPNTRTVRWWLNPEPPEFKPKKLEKWGPSVRVEPPEPIDDKFTGFEDVVKTSGRRVPAIPKPPKPAPATTEPPPPAFFAAAYVDGTVEIRVKGVRLLLNSEDAQKLARLLNGTR